MNKSLYIILNLMCQLHFIAQNLVSNPSFSEVYPKKDSMQFYQISQVKSDVKNWYVPDYIHFDTTIGNAGIRRMIRYFSSRDKYLIPTDGKQHDEIMTNGDQLFENNLGFIRINSNEFDSPPLIQQRLQTPLKKGDYCLKFKYKYIGHFGGTVKPPVLHVVISPTNLREYYTDNVVKVPWDYIKASLKDTSRKMDENTPWQQCAYKIKLNGDEQFLSVGSLKNKYGIFFIDDIELYKLKSPADSCSALKIEKNLSRLYSKEFPLNKKLENDTMVMYYPPFNIGSYIISPEAKLYLNTIISFMQRNPSVKIKFIEYENYLRPNMKPGHYQYFRRYLIFFGIDETRITAENEMCKDARPAYCGRNRIFVKIGFLFYK